MRKRKIIASLLILLSFSCVYGLAKETGKIQGKVVDESGEGLPGVEITAASPNLQGMRSIISLKSGDFHFPLLPTGKYTLTLKLERFSTIIQENIIVRLGRVTYLIIPMKMTGLQEEIVVTAPAPLIDKTSIDTSYLMGSDELEKIPAQNRTVVDATKFTPGVTSVRINSRQGTSAQGQPSFRGEGEEGNTWIVDGLSISGVRLKNSGMQINYDSVEEIQIISDPFSPEYGSAYGGIINMVTKTGSNSYGGEFSLIFQDKNLQAQRQDQLSLASSPDYFSNYNWIFNFGGPIIKDKLWFFLSNNLFSDSEQTKDGTLDYFSVPGGERAQRYNNLFLKLSYALSNSHTLSVTSMYNKSFRVRGGIGIPELYEKKTFSDMIFRMNYKGILSSSSFIEAGLGMVKIDSLIQPVDGNLGPAQYYIEDLAQSIHNSYGDVTDDTKRMDFNIKLTKYLETDTFGHHELSVGFEFYDVSSTFAVDFAGKDEDIFPGNGFDSGSKYNFITWRDGQRTPAFFFEYGTFNFINSSRGIGFFLKDKFTLKRFTFMAGLRGQTQTSFDGKKEELWSWGLADFLSPRLSLSIDLTGDGVNILKLGWGRFSDIITTMPLGLLSSGAGLTFRTSAWTGNLDPSENELHDPANWTFSNEQKNQSFEIASGLEPNFLNRFLIEYDRRLGKNWAFLARYVRTSATDLLEVLAVFDVTTGYKFLYDNFEHKRRNYWGFEFELIGKIGTSFFLNASYCYSSAKGTNPGQTETGSWSQEEGSTNFIGLFGNHLFIPDLYQLGGLGGRGIGDAGWYGKLPYSVDHNIKAHLIYLAPHGITFSTAFEYISGYYWEKLGYVPFFGGYYSFPETRGARETPPHFYLDIGLEKELSLKAFKLSERMSLTLRIDVFNLLNSQTAISYVKEDVPIFGEIWGRQQPRQARIMIKVKF
jgi:hypothetical protein